MNSDVTRKVTVEAMIGLSVCFGLHFMLVDPLRQQLAETRGKIIALEQSMPSSVSQEAGLPKTIEALARAQAEADEIKARGILALDESAMFSRIMQVAAEHGTRIDQMEPRSPANDIPRPDASASPAPAIAARPGDAAIGYAITATAEYSQLCAFLRAIQNDIGYTLVRSVRLHPSPDPLARTLTAVIETAHFSFNASPEPLAGAAAELPGGISR